VFGAPAFFQGDDAAQGSGSRSVPHSFFAGLQSSVRISAEIIIPFYNDTAPYSQQGRNPEGMRVGLSCLPGNCCALSLTDVSSYPKDSGVFALGLFAGDSKQILVIKGETIK
jgi:hypothetical protein